jgi:hypothetical protein
LRGIASGVVFYAKFLALGAGLLWAVLFLAPARALSGWFNGPKTSFSLKRIRPVVDALAVYVALLMGIVVVDYAASARAPRVHCSRP